MALAIALNWTPSAQAQALLFDGGFESGTFIGWSPGTQGTAILVAKNRCFSDQDTSALSIRDKYAGLLRGAAQKDPGAVATMTSKPFTAGKGFLFLALTEQHAGDDAIWFPYALRVSVLDSNGITLSGHELNTARITLSSGCPSLARDQRFSEHFISTQKYQGQTIRIRFSQHPALAQSGNFSLIDQVSIVQQGETAAYRKKPAAIAGIEYDAEHDFLYLVAKTPKQALEKSRNWRYSWQIHAQTDLRETHKACINDLKPGNHTAVLSVQNATTLSMDSLHFYVPERRQQSTGADPAWAACKTAAPKSGSL